MQDPMIFDSEVLNANQQLVAQSRDEQVRNEE